MYLDKEVYTGEKEVRDSVTRHRRVTLVINSLVVLCVALKEFLKEEYTRSTINVTSKELN